VSEIGFLPQTATSGPYESAEAAFPPNLQQAFKRPEAETCHRGQQLAESAAEPRRPEVPFLKQF
jgi:hypothetical protein